MGGNTKRSEMGQFETFAIGKKMIKMNVLQRFMILFQAIPIIRKEAILEGWQKIINSLCGRGKGHG